MNDIHNYQCCKCKYKWSQGLVDVYMKDRQWAKMHTDRCPKCGHKWIKWLNYEKWKNE